MLHFMKLVAKQLVLKLCRNTIRLLHLLKRNKYSFVIWANRRTLGGVLFASFPFIGAPFVSSWQLKSNICLPRQTLLFYRKNIIQGSAAVDQPPQSLFFCPKWSKKAAKSSALYLQNRLCKTSKKCGRWTRTSKILIILGFFKIGF